MKAEVFDVWKDATVLLTGGTGWLGRRFVEHALGTLGVKSIRVFSRDEHKHHAMRQRWSDTAPDSRITYIVGDVRDRDRVSRAAQGASIIVHAAALKRVEGGSTHAEEHKKTNVDGTLNVRDAALDASVYRNIFVSSDKACMPTNAYGKSKALAEDLWIEGNALAGAYPRRFSVVRYGNVLGSTGSVLDIWRAAVAAGEPLPLTNPKMTRFWMTVQGAVAFIVDAARYMRGGEIFVPDMPRARMVDLSSAAFPHHPLRVEGERHGGEKFHETAIGRDEARHATTLDWRSYAIWPQRPTWDAKYTRSGEKLPEGFELRSDTEPLMDEVQLRRLLDEAAVGSRWA